MSETPFLGEASALLAHFRDPEVTDILVNGVDSLYVERAGELLGFASPFRDRGAVFDFVERLLVPLGKRVDSLQPFVDGRIGDEGRFHVILPPLVAGAPHVSLRKSRGGAAAPWESFGEPRALALLSERFLAGDNLLVVGPTGSGKTTLLTRLLERVPASERLVILEESREIRADHPHAVRLEARAPGPDAVGEVTLRTLVRQSLRMRPDRLILGECRGAEAFDLLLALTTGHRGSAATLHGGSCREGLRRLESLVLSAGTGVPLAVAREWIAGALRLVVRVERRRIVELAALTGLEGDVYRMAPLIPSKG